MIQLTCPECKKALRAEDRLAGRTVKCPNCKTPVAIPNKPTAEIQAEIVTASQPTSVPSARADHARSICNRATMDMVPVQMQPQMSVSVSPPLRRSNSLGVSSIVLGILGLLICWIPILGLLGLPLSLLGLGLAIIGLLLAIIRKGAGIGYPIAGLAIAGLAALVASAQLAVLLSEPVRLVRDAAQRAKQEVATEKPESQDWIVIGQPLRIQDVEVRLIGSTIGPVPLIDALGEAMHSTKQYLKIRLEIQNCSSAKVVHYRTWRGGDFSLTRDYAVLRDDQGNLCHRVDFGVTARVAGAIAESESIYPGKTVTDLLIFEPPVDLAKNLYLELPGKNLGLDEPLRFRIPDNMIDRSNP